MSRTRFQAFLPALVLASLMLGQTASADVFNMPAGLTSLQFVTIGNPGNTPDPFMSKGAVSLTYQIGKYEVTAGQYAEFLNAVAKTDTYGLYVFNMGNIQRSGSSGTYAYSVASDWANRPINYIRWGDAARFANWLHNGQASGIQNLSTTEDGAYFLNGATTDTALMAISRKADARYAIPSGDEWHKAAYYDPAKSGSGGYWHYPTRSDAMPSNVLDPNGTDNVNCRDMYGTGNGGDTIGAPYWRTEVGAFSSSSSPYGTFDQGGNVAEWTEEIENGSYRVLQGGDYSYPPCGSGCWVAGPPSLSLSPHNGFRVVHIRTLAGVEISAGPATVPEGGGGNYACTAHYHDGTTQDVTASATWSVASGPGLISASGVYTAPGTVLIATPVTIHASYTDEHGTTIHTDKNITIQNTIRILNSVSITSGPATVNEGNTAGYTCTATYDDGTTQNVTAAAAWSVTSGPGSFTTPGTYAAGATVVADTPATLHVTYTEGGVTKEADKGITVKNTVRILVSVSIATGPDTVNEGTTGIYTCTATYDDATTQTVTAAWTVVTGPGVFSTTATYTAPSLVLADTAATIRATYSEGGITKQADKAIIVKNSSRILTGIAIATDPTTVPEGGTGEFTCTATYDDASTQNVTASATWTVTAGSGSFSSPGTYAAPASVLADTAVTVRASYTEGGLTKQADKSFTVKNSIHVPTALSITAGPATVQMAGTGSYTATATFDDATTTNVTATSVWSVTTGPGSFPSAGDYTSPTSVTVNTPATIKATYTEAGVTKEATKAITITPPPADTDKDGVPDTTDQCPATAAGATVNTQGCSTAQVTDTDKDGTVDALDSCPNDPAKVGPGLCGCGKVDTVGCNSEYTLRITTNQTLSTGAPVPEPYPAGTAVDIYAPLAPDGYHFDHWSGDLSGTTNPIHITMSRDINIQANYVVDAADPTPSTTGSSLCGAGAPVAVLMTCFGLIAMRLTRRDDD